MTDPLQQELADLTAEHREFAGEVNGHLTTITEEQAKIRREHADQARWISETGPIIDEHGQALDRHADRLAEDTTLLAGLREDVNLVLAEMPRQPKHPPVCWVGLTADQAEQTWMLLGEWVDEILVGRYFVDRRQLPDCWALHPGAVEELSWLRTAWLHAFVPTAGAVPAAEWHTRWRSAALDAVADAVVREAVVTRKNKCGPGVHLGEALPGATPPPAPDPAAQPQPAGAYVTPYASAQGWSGNPPTWSPAQAPGWSPTPTGPPVSVPRGPATKTDITRDPAEDLAERGYWWPHLERAAAVDVAARRDVEARAAAAAAAEAAGGGGA
ncbi:hypothetical protein ACFXGA_26960 [Actinosynnema sp. NPDC059335]|uniref:hypothetical protein n=1 Tax=Actinosynnema sp. NPDC059335 TaxID=3346804 RepID=UPI00366FF3B0